MSRITLKSLVIVNFKGVRFLQLDFTQQATVIAGANGTGKTTIFDAFNWLLFGKDSTGRSDFNIKTIDPATKKPILHLEHYVAGVLDVDGREVKLKRCYCEKWSRATAKTEERLINHYTDFYINDVKMGTKDEYDSQIAEIIPEEIFKLVTNPYCFVRLKPDQQKALLMAMVGTISNEEVAGSNESFIKLLEELRVSNKSLEVYAKEVAAKKKACNDELKLIPSNIATAQRLRPQPQDWEALESQKKQKEDRLRFVDDQITDKSKATEAEYKRKADIQSQIGEKRLALSKAENEIRNGALSGINQAKMELQRLQFDLSNAQASRNNLARQLQNKEAQISQIENEIKEMKADYVRIYREVMPPIPEGNFVCPTCKRPLEASDIEAKKAELIANFNGNKSQRLKENEEKGKWITDELAKHQKERNDIIASIAEWDGKISVLTAQVNAKQASIPATPNVDGMIASDPCCQAIRNEIYDLENQLTMNAKTVDISDLKKEKMQLQAEIKELDRSLLQRETIQNVDNEIKDLEEKKIANNQALAELEGWEMVALEFQKAKDAKLQEKIDSLFSYVSFSFIKEHLNGKEKVTCVCTVNGTPYPDVNAAGKLNAGLDIINAVCKFKGVSAPVFVDNSESVNDIIPIQSQCILLRVTRDAELNVE